MQYLLDTCVVSDFVKGDPNTLQRLKLISPDDISVSAVTSMELKYGLKINPQRAIKIQPLITSFLTAVFMYLYHKLISVFFSSFAPLRLCVR